MLSCHLPENRSRRVVKYMGQRKNMRIMWISIGAPKFMIVGCWKFMTKENGVHLLFFD